jgi:hypothetical protein
MSAPYQDKGWRPEAPPLQGRGLGWGLSNAQLQELHRRADQGRTQILKVNGVTHFGEAQNESDQPMGIAGATVQLICEEI